MKSLAAVSTVLLAAGVILVSCSMSQDLYDYHQRSATDGEDSFGIAIDVGDGLVTREDPATPLTDIFYVKLKGQPSGDVFLGTIQSLSLDEVDVSPASLTFTQSNWNIEQAITVTGVDDGIADNVQIAVIDLGTLSGGGYDNYDPGDVTVQNLDDETAGSPAVILMNDGLVTDESGGLNDFFSIVLNEPPAANVSIGTIMSTDTGEITLAPSSLTFTTANWNSPQNVNLNGVNDTIFDGIQMVTINLGSTTSADPNWDGMALGSVTAYNLDDDGPKGITVLAGTTNNVGEGTVSQFEVVLDAQPSADVTINVSSSNGEANVAPSSLVFTTANWNIPQTLTVTGVDDAEADGLQTCSINLSNAVSSDTEYSGMVPTPNSVPYDVLDDDSAGITVNAAPTLTISELATTQSFTVVLNSQPVGDVDIAVSSSDTGEGIITAPGGGMLTFTTGNWNVPQTVTVEGVDDGLVDGNQPFEVVLGAAASADTDYNGMNPDDVTCITTDDESNKDILVLAGPSSLVSENGGSSEFEVVLTDAPTANVTFSVSSGDTTEGTVSTPSLTFTTGNWNTPQPVQVFGVDDAIQDNNVTFFINFGTAASTDTDYNGITPTPLSFDNIDDDSVGITVSAGSFMYLSEAGTSSSFEVVLNSQPTAGVDISVSSSDPTAGAVSTGLLTFTTGNWSTPQPVTVTGADDTLQDGSQAFTVDLSSSSADPDYDLLGFASLDFETVDDDSAGVTVDIGDGLVTTETGATDTFQIVLNSEPTDSVDITLTSGDIGEATVNPIGVSFSPANWFLPVTITVTGVDDFAVDGTQPAVIDLGTVFSVSDINYDGLIPDDVTVYNVDDDSLKQVVVLANPKGYFTSENGASTQIAVVLSEQPTANVTLGPLSSTDASEGSVSPASLTFTPADWNIPHMVTVTGVADGGKGDGKVFYDVDLGMTSSTDLLFDGIAGGSVTVTSIDSMFIDEYVWILPTPAPFNSIGPSGSATGMPIMFREVDFQDGYVAEDEGYEVIPIGFDFFYMGRPREQIMVFTNGFASFNMYLNTASFWNDALILSSASAPPEPDADLFIDILSPWWDDLHTALVPGAVYFETSGIMPNRVLTIEWEDVRYTVSSNNTYSFQIKLYEYSNRIEFCYGPFSGPGNDSTASVGIKDDIGGDGHFIDGLNGAMVEAGSSFAYDYPDFPSNSMGEDVFIGFDPTL